MRAWAAKPAEVLLIAGEIEFNRTAACLVAGATIACYWAIYPANPEFRAWCQDPVII